MRPVHSYVERAPLPAGTGVLRTVWIHSTDDCVYLQRRPRTYERVVAVHEQIVGVR